MGQLTIELAKKIKLDGFRKKGMTWRKSVENIIQVINFQSSRFNEKGSESFTINVGIYSKAIYELTWGKDGPANPQESDCIFRTRISYFRNDSRDWWWGLQTEADIRIVETEVTTLLRERVMPFFETVASEADAYQLMRNHKDRDTQYPLYQIQLGCLAVQMGDREDGLHILEKVRQSPVWGENAVKALTRLQAYSSDKLQ